jgi:hypothetical protein
MAGDAQMIEHADGGVALVFAARRKPTHQRRDLGKLRDAGIDARQGVGLVVDNDEQFKPVEGG